MKILMKKMKVTNVNDFLPPNMFNPFDNITNDPGLADLMLVSVLQDKDNEDQEEHKDNWPHT